MKRRTIVVEGPLAFRMRRIAAARDGELGIQIMTLPLLAARLAGGFIQPASHPQLLAAIRTALDEGGFEDLEGLRLLPGTPRSVAHTLAKIWRSDVSLAECSGKHARLADVAAIEQRVRDSLSAGILLPRDLRDAALHRVEHAATVLGPVELERLGNVAPVWRPLVGALSTHVPVSWHNPGVSDTGWYKGALAVGEQPPSAAIAVASCADPRAEVVEALRWLRELIASGRARPGEVAICAPATGQWDDHFYALAAEAHLPLHFSHGTPALASYDGQTCCALADILINGLSQTRIRRLLDRRAGLGAALQDLPPTWSSYLRRDAALFDVDQWQGALADATARRTDGIDARPALMPLLELLDRGTGHALEAGERVLGGGARLLWNEALRQAPAKALEYSLQDLRLPDGRDPGASAVWCPANHLAAAPRQFVRLIGMNARMWPRRTAEDPLLPSHILARRLFDSDSVTEADRRAFEVITAHASGACVLSTSRRSAQGGLLAVSPLLPTDNPTRVFMRARLAEHALSESDRLFARPAEAATVPLLAQAAICWRSRWQPGVTSHDGRVRADHPVVVRAIERVQSATSLRLMLRDPLGFVWRYALGWAPLDEDDQPITLDGRAYGKLVHELLRRSVDALEPDPGYARAQRHEIEAALAAAAAVIRAQWPLERPVPPQLMWQHLLEAARNLALKALTQDPGLQSGTRSWTEVEFGRPETATTSPRNLPWPPDAPVTIPGTAVRVRGSIDRVDLRAAGDAVRVSDYKTGAEPKRAAQMVIGRGIELQRVVYASAARQLLPGNPHVVSRLFYLSAKEPKEYRLPDVDAAIAEVATHVGAALALLRRGIALPGPDARETWNDFRLAMPASAATYLELKNGAFMRAFGDLTRVWSAQ
jgi:RecB family exonuclease